MAVPSQDAGGVNEGSAQSVAGGNPTTGANTTGAGALTLTANSNLDFGLGASTLVFNSFNDSGNFTLNVLNYANTDYNDGTMTSGIDGTDDRLIFTSDPSAYLSDINFGAGKTASEINLGGGVFEVGVSAVPEPTTIFAGLLDTRLGWLPRAPPPGRFGSRRVSGAKFGSPPLVVDE